MFTPGLRVCAYKTASGRANWPNHDPIEEYGFLSQYFQTASLEEKIDVYFRTETPDPRIYVFVQNNPVLYFDRLGLFKCDSPSTVVGPIAADKSEHFDLASLMRHKWDPKNPPATVIWSKPCPSGSKISDMEVTKKPTQGSGGERISGDGLSASMSVETRYALFHSGEEGQKASEAKFCCTGCKP